MNEITVKITTKKEPKREPIEDEEEEDNLYLKDNNLHIFTDPPFIRLVTRPKEYITRHSLHEQSTHRADITMRMQEIENNKKIELQKQIQLAEDIELNMKKFAKIMFEYRKEGIENFKDLVKKRPFAHAPVILKNEIQQKQLDLEELKLKIKHMDDRINTYRNMRVCFQGNINQVLDGSDAEYLAKVSKSLNNSTINNIMNSYNIDMGTAIRNLATSTQKLYNKELEVNKGVLTNGFRNDVQNLPEPDDLFDYAFNEMIKSYEGTANAPSAMVVHDTKPKDNNKNLVQHELGNWKV